MGNNVAPEVTDLTGGYAFGSMPTGGAYQVAPQKDDDYLFGVSTLDLIMIQRHILGIELLDSPYRIIAADVDNNKVINGVDLVELRKLILGIYADLPSNESWRFISSDYQFVNSIDPWATHIDETYEIANLSSNMVVDFVGVKVGDVNNSAMESVVGPLVSRELNAVEFTARHESTTQNEISSIIISSNNYEEVRGWQAALDIDTDLVEVLDVIPLGLDSISLIYKCLLVL